jgi:hypothetical protein
MEWCGSSSPCGEGGWRVGNGGRQAVAVALVLHCPKVEDESGWTGCWAIRPNGSQVVADIKAKKKEWACRDLGPK